MVRGPAQPNPAFWMGELGLGSQPVWPGWENIFRPNPVPSPISLYVLSHLTYLSMSSLSLSRLTLLLVLSLTFLLLLFLTSFSLSCLTSLFLFFLYQYLYNQSVMRTFSGRTSNDDKRERAVTLLFNWDGSVRRKACIEGWSVLGKGGYYHMEEMVPFLKIYLKSLKYLIIIESVPKLIIFI